MVHKKATVIPVEVPWQVRDRMDEEPPDSLSAKFRSKINPAILLRVYHEDRPFRFEVFLVEQRGTQSAAVVFRTDNLHVCEDTVKLLEVFPVHLSDDLHAVLRAAEMANVMNSAN